MLERRHRSVRQECLLPPVDLSDVEPWAMVGAAAAYKGRLAVVFAACCPTVMGADAAHDRASHHVWSIHPVVNPLIPTILLAAD